MGLPLQVAGANGIVGTVAGTCKVCLKVQGLAADLMWHGSELGQAYEVNV